MHYLSPEEDSFYMEEALAEARKAFEEGEVPIGAVVVARGKIIARAYNLVERLSDPTAHAEMLAITAATNALGGKYLTDCTLYVTLEPCPMCMGALRWAKISAIVYAAEDSKGGFRTLAPLVPHPKTVFRSNVLAEKSISLMQSFFKSRR